MKHSKTCYFVPLIVNTEKTCVCNIDKYEALKNLLLFSSNCKHGETLLLSSTLLKDDEVVEDLSFVGWVLGDWVLGAWNLLETNILFYFEGWVLGAWDFLETNILFYLAEKLFWKIVFFFFNFVLKTRDFNVNFEISIFKIVKTRFLRLFFQII